MTRRALVVVAVALVAVVAVGCGNTTDGSSATTTLAGTSTAPRLIKITMSDDTFEPEALTAHTGETVTLRFHNAGTVRHEAVIGDETVQTMHAEMMATMTTGATTTTAKLQGYRRHPGMNAPNVISVEAGATGEVTYSLAKKAHLLIGCHEVGHYEAGMVATLDVT